MAKLYFKYGAMGSSKSAQALITQFNYEELGMSVWLIKPSIDTRDGADIVQSRIGLKRSAEVITPEQNIIEAYAKAGRHDVIIADEAQFFTPEQIDQMQAYCDEATRLIEAEEDYSAADAKFHQYLAECSGNHVLPNLIPIIASAIGVVITVTNDEHRSQSGMEHQRIVDAIRRHDPEGAKYSMIAHLNTSRNSMLHSRDNCAAKR